MRVEQCVEYTDTNKITSYQRWPKDTEVIYRAYTVENKQPTAYGSSKTAIKFPGRNALKLAYTSVTSADGLEQSLLYGYSLYQLQAADELATRKTC